MVAIRQILRMEVSISFSGIAFLPIRFPSLPSTGFPQGIRLPAYVIRDGRTRPLGVSPAYMENREEYLLQSKGLEHVRAALSTVNCRLVVQHVAMSDRKSTRLNSSH